MVIPDVPERIPSRVTYSGKIRLPRGERNSHSRLTDAKVLEIYRLADKEGLSHAEIAKRMGVTRSTVSKVIRGESWLHMLKYR